MWRHFFSYWSSIRRLDHLRLHSTLYFWIKSILIWNPSWILNMPPADKKNERETSTQYGQLSQHDDVEEGAKNAKWIVTLNFYLLYKYTYNETSLELIEMGTFVTLFRPIDVKSLKYFYSCFLLLEICLCRELVEWSERKSGKKKDSSIMVSTYADVKRLPNLTAKIDKYKRQFTTENKQKLKQKA